MGYQKPYAGLKVLDMSQGVAGPHCGFLLGQYGADVVKLEPPGGDWVRALGKLVEGQTPMSAAYTAGKRGIAVDLKDERGKDIALELAARSDIVIESSRPGVADRLGIGFEAVKALNPKVIYVSVSGFGQTGPYRDRPLSDTAAQAFSGVMAANRAHDGSPTKMGLILCDVVTGLYAFQAAAMALAGRDQEPEGIHLDISLMNASAAMMSPKIAEYVFEGGQPALLNSPAGNYRTRDGWIAIALVKEANFKSLCEALGCTDIAADPDYQSFAARGERDAELKARLAPFVAEWETEALQAHLQAHNVVCNRINDALDWLEDPQVLATNTPESVPFAAGQAVPLVRPPGSASLNELSAPTQLGEYTAAVLEELGYDEAAVKALADAGVVALGDSRL